MSQPVPTRAIPRDVAQTLIAKLDRNFIKASDAKSIAWHPYGVELRGRTRAQVADALSRHLVETNQVPTGGDTE